MVGYKRIKKMSGWMDQLLNLYTESPKNIKLNEIFLLILDFLINKGNPILGFGDIL